MIGLNGEAARATAGARQAMSWRLGQEPPAFDPHHIARTIGRIREPVHVLDDGEGGFGLGYGGTLDTEWDAVKEGYTVKGTLPPLYPEWLGGRSFNEAHGVRFPYVAGEMANGIATTRLVTAMASAGMLGFFGAGGLGYDRVERAIGELNNDLAGKANWGVNLIHSPSEPVLEERVAGLLVDRRVPCVSASAFMRLTPAVVRCAAAGLRLSPDGEVVRARRLFAKVSRAEVAEQFMSPPPGDLLAALVARGELTEIEARLAARLPVAEDITVEADSGGHTDNRPLVALLPVMFALRDRLSVKFGYRQPIRVGAAGGLGAPSAVAAAFSLGAAYVVVGSVNQSAVESGLSSGAKAMLAEADMTDVTMAPAADMFEMGVKVQVLKRGTMFATRAAWLYDLYKRLGSLADLSPGDSARLERDIFRGPIDEAWARTAAFWAQRDPAELQRAEHDQKHRMALLFRWYLGLSSRWAIDGDEARRADYQVWCGPAIGAFNRWTAGSFLADPTHRDVVQIALNLLEGAAVVTRAQQLRTYGVPVPSEGFHYQPRRLSY